MSQFLSRPPALGRFAVGDVMGKGMQASVYKGKDLNSDSEVALRVVDRRQLNAAKLGRLEAEINMMKLVSGHPNVIGLQHVEMDTEWQNLDGTSSRVALMVLELADHGELFDYLMYSGHFSDEITRAYMRQLMSALELCHSKNIYHRDIKPENILLDGNFQLKLADFGLSTAQVHEDAMLQTDCGTKPYMAPEVLASTQYLGANADIWSSTVVMFTMLCGNPPFQAANKQDWWFNAISLKRHDRFWAAHLRSAPHVATNTLAQNFINHIFLKNPEERYTLEQIAADPWFGSGIMLTPDQLKMQMMQKKMAVNQGKEQEAREAANRARRGGGSGGGQFDPFGAATTYRSIETKIGSELPQLEVCVVDKLAQTSFFSSVAPVKIVSGFATAVNSIDKDCTAQALEGGFGLRVNIKHGGDSIDFEGEVIEIPAVPIEFDARLTVVQNAEGEQQVYCIEMVRLSGDIMRFQETFKQIRSYFLGMESAAAIAEENSLKSCFMGTSSEQNDEEPPLSESMPMLL